MLFYEAQRAGHLPADERVKWRGDSNLGDDPQGGYYDAGDFLKFGFPAAAMTTNLAWGAISFLEGYNNCGELEYIKKTIKWSTDYMIDANRLPNEFIGQIGNGDADHNYWGRPEDMNMDRPVYDISPSKPGSDLAGETAAALAAASIFYNNIGETALADEALENARELFDFANQYKGKYSDSISDASIYYNSWSGYNDELAWGAAWLYKATDPAYEKCVDNYVSGLKPGAATYTPGGLLFVDNWGSNRHAGNNAHLCAQLANMGYQTATCDEFVDDQIGYILGDNPNKRSYVVGFGENPPVNPHHRASSCPDMPAPCGQNEQYSSAANPQTLYGA